MNKRIEGADLLVDGTIQQVDQALTAIHDRLRGLQAALGQHSDRPVGVCVALADDTRKLQAWIEELRRSLEHRRRVRKLPNAPAWNLSCESGDDDE